MRSMKGKGHTKSDSALIFFPIAPKSLVNFSLHPFFLNILGISNDIYCKCKTPKIIRCKLKMSLWHLSCYQMSILIIYWLLNQHSLSRSKIKIGRGLNSELRDKSCFNDCCM